MCWSPATPGVGMTLPQQERTQSQARADVAQKALEMAQAEHAVASQQALNDADAKVIITCPGRNFVTLKIETDEGLTGIGDASLNGRELAVAAYLSEHVVPCLIGRDAHQIEDIWQYLYRGAYWRRGPGTRASSWSAISAPRATCA